MDDIEIRPSTPDDVRSFFPTLKTTVRAWSIWYKGELSCVAGVAFTPSLMLAFMQIKEGVEAPKMTIWRCTKIVWENIKSLGFKRLYAMANPKLWTAPQYLERLGFKHIESSARGEVYLWQIQ